MLECCPKASKLPHIPDSGCPFNIRQIQRLVFQRRGFSFVDKTNAETEAQWSPLTTATDNTFVVATPPIGGNPIITAGEPITEGGGDNTTMNGIERVVGTNPSLFTAEFRSLSSSEENALKKLICERDLTVYFANEQGKLLGHIQDDGTITGVPITAFHITDRDSQGYGTDDKNMIRFSLVSGWSSKLVVLDTEFNPLTYFVDTSI